MPACSGRPNVVRTARDIVRVSHTSVDFCRVMWVLAIVILRHSQGLRCTLVPTPFCPTFLPW
eukprot:149047-Amphidinium_carterae.4